MESHSTTCEYHSPTLSPPAAARRLEEEEEVDGQGHDRRSLPSLLFVFGPHAVAIQIYPSILKDLETSIENMCWGKKATTVKSLQEANPYYF